MDPTEVVPDFAHDATRVVSPCCVDRQPHPVPLHNLETV